MRQLVMNGYHHRHYMGSIEPVEYVGYEATLERFQREWLEITNQQGRKKP